MYLYLYSGAIFVLSHYRAYSSFWFYRTMLLQSSLCYCNSVCLSVDQVTAMYCIQWRLVRSDCDSCLLRFDTWMTLALSWYYVLFRNLFNVFRTLYLVHTLVMLYEGCVCDVVVLEFYNLDLCFNTCLSKISRIVLSKTCDWNKKKLTWNVLCGALKCTHLSLSTKKMSPLWTALDAFRNGQSSYNIERA